MGRGNEAMLDYAETEDTFGSPLASILPKDGIEIGPAGDVTGRGYIQACYACSSSPAIDSKIQP
jgi:hypothetical protein